MDHDEATAQGRPRFLVRPEEAESISDVLAELLVDALEPQDTTAPARRQPAGAPRKDVRDVSSPRD
jgi:hypothetical protein